jgi:hypothetical protein
LSAAGSAIAHEVGTTKVAIAVADRSYAVDISTDAASLLGRLQSPAGEVISGSLEAGEYERRLRTLTDAIRSNLDLRFDSLVALPAIEVQVSADEFAIAKARVHLSGATPDAVRVVSWRYDLTGTTYQLDVMSNGRTDTQWLEPGQASRPAQLVRNSRAPDSLRVFRLGLNRVLPGGTEQILLIVVLVVGARRSMVREFFAFAIGESVAIGLTFGWPMSALSATSGAVPALVALSIAGISAERVFAPAADTGRLVPVFAAGLIHGVSLAPSSNLLVALLPFAAGVQVGQAAVLLMALLLIGSEAGGESRRRQVAVPACIVIGITGFAWTLQRFL